MPEALCYDTLFIVKVEINLNLSLNRKYWYLEGKTEHQYNIKIAANVEALNLMLVKHFFFFFFFFGRPTDQIIYLVIYQTKNANSIQKPIKKVYHDII